MLWVCPFVSADSVEYRFLAEKGYLIMEKGSNELLWSNTKNIPAIIRWWNGASAVLDLTNPGAEEWFRDKLDRLQDAYGVDGFKFDAGDPVFYRGDYKTNRKVSAEEHSSLYARLGLGYDLNEYRACWKTGGQALAQRLQDKQHNWEDLAGLIPETLIQGLAGYPFSCPDMIGGGEYLSFLNLDSIDQELVVRSAQCSALMPMMQFSAAPWRILDEKHRQICLETARLHAEKADLFLQLAENASRTGEPIVRSLEYSFPGEGYEEIKNQFLIGDSLMAAPVVRKGERSRKVSFPTGVWKDAEGILRKGPCEQVVDAPLEKLLWFERI
jgi:alpha-glucosidase